MTRTSTVTSQGVSNASEKSLENVERVAKNYTTKVQGIYYNCNMTMSRILHQKYMKEEFEFEM